MVSPNYILFCDETGSTGSRFLDPAQPHYAEGGWFISNLQRDSAAKAVLDAENRFSASAKELKGAELVRKPRGQAFLRHVCEGVGRAGGLPFIIIVEKRYAVCSRIVETFLDPDYNPEIPVSETWDPEKRQADAELFYSRDDSLIQEFAEAYRLLDSPRLKTNAESWVTLLRASGLPDEASRVAGVLPNLEEAVEIERMHLSSGKFPSGMDSLNLPVVTDVFQFVEQDCPFPCGIIHDQTASFQPVYQFIFKLFSNGSPMTVELKGGRRLCAGFKNAVSLTFRDSKLEPLIRAADYALAGTRKFVQLALANEPISADLTNVAFATLGTLLLNVYAAKHPSIGTTPELARTMASRSWNRRVFDRLHHELATPYKK
jgi:Protein of unknown function (DUF3800)